MTKIVFSDIDRTLLFDGEIGQRTVRLIEEVQQRCPFVLCTARREQKYQMVKDMIPHDHAIYESGGIIRVDGSLDAGWDDYVAGSREAMRQAEQSIGYAAEWKRHAFVLRIEQLGISPKEVERIRGLDLPDVTIRINQGKYIDVFPSAAGKDNAIRRLCDKLDIPLGETAAMGDDDNDMDMFNVCKQLYAVGNSLPRIKAVVSGKGGYVSRYSGHEGAQDVLEKVLENV